MVHHRVHRILAWRGPAGDARHLRRGRRGGAHRRSGRGRGRVRHPGAGGPASGAVIAWSTHLPLDGVPFRDLMSERLGLPVLVDNDANVALLAEYRARRGRGRGDAVMLTLGTGIGGGLLLDGQVYRGARRARGRSSATSSWTTTGRLPGRLPRPRLPRGACVGDRDRPRGGRAGARDPGLGARAAAGGRARDHRRDRHGAGPRRRPGGARGAGRRRARGSASAWSSARERVQPGDDRDRRRRASRRATCCSTRRAQVVAERALPPTAGIVRVVRAHFGERGGDDRRRAARARRARRLEVGE